MLFIRNQVVLGKGEFSGETVYARGSDRRGFAEINGLILRISRGEYLLPAETTRYNLRKGCGECSSMN